MPSDASDADARDRTALSWERSALALGVLAALFVSAADRGPWLALPVAVLLALAGLAVAAYGRGLARRRALGTPVAPAWSAARGLTAVTLLSVVFAIAVVIGQP